VAVQKGKGTSKSGAGRMARCQRSVVEEQSLPVSWTCGAAASPPGWSSWAAHACMHPTLLLVVLRGPHGSRAAAAARSPLQLAHAPWAAGAPIGIGCRHGCPGGLLGRGVGLVILPDDGLPSKALAPVVHLCQLGLKGALPHQLLVHIVQPAGRQVGQAGR
jgi:hypothetical protein